MKKRMLITGGSGLLALNWAQSQKNHFEITLGLNKRQVNLDGVSVLNINTSSYDSLLADIELVNPTIIFKIVKYLKMSAYIPQLPAKCCIRFPIRQTQIQRPFC